MFKVPKREPYYPPKFHHIAVDWPDSILEQYGRIDDDAEDKEQAYEEGVRDAAKLAEDHTAQIRVQYGKNYETLDLTDLMNPHGFNGDKVSKFFQRSGVPSKMREAVWNKIKTLNPKHTSDDYTITNAPKGRASGKLNMKFKSVLRERAKKGLESKRH